MVQQLTLAELKRRKNIEVTRVDNLYKSNEELTQELETFFTDKGYTILEKKQVDEIRVEYIFLNKDIVSTQRVYVGGDKELAEKVVKEQTLPVLSYELDGSSVSMQLQGETKYFTLILHRHYSKQVQEGTITFRSKDYVFNYVDDNNEEHKIFGDMLKASNIQDNKIILDYGIEYLIK